MVVRAKPHRQDEENVIGHAARHPRWRKNYGREELLAFLRTGGAKLTIKERAS